MAKSEHVKMTLDLLEDIWHKAAEAKAQQERTEGQLYGAFCQFAVDNTLNAEAFMAQTKALEEKLMEAATGSVNKAAVRSTSSSARSVVSLALEKGLTPVRMGRTVGKSRLESERKAVDKGHPVDDVMKASVADLAKMKETAWVDPAAPSQLNPQNEDGADAPASEPTPKATNTLPPAQQQEGDVVMNLADNLKLFLSSCREETVKDMAYELFEMDRLGQALMAEAEERIAKAHKKAA